MLKLSISFDEIFKSYEISWFDNEEDAYDILIDFLDNQFPEWNSEEAFDFDSVEWDFDNKEVSILMYNINDFSSP
jgi:hypothetical protein